MAIRWVSTAVLFLLAGCVGQDPSLEPDLPEDRVSLVAPIFSAPKLANSGGNAYEPGVKVAPDGSLWLHAHKANLVAEGAFLATWVWWSGDNGTTWTPAPSPGGIRDRLHSYEGDVAFDNAGNAWFFEKADPSSRLTSWSLSPDGPVWRSTVPITLKLSYDDRPWLEAFGDGQIYLLSKTPENPQAGPGGVGFAPFVLWSSADGGLTWRDVKAFPDSAWCDIGMAPGDGQRMAVGCDVRGHPVTNEVAPRAIVWVSNDGGATWEQTELSTLAAAPANQFVSTAMDEEGNAFHAWIDDDLEDDLSAVLNVARKLGGHDWEVLQPNIFNGSLERVWVTAAAGRLAVTFSGQEESNGARWFPYALVTEGPQSSAPLWSLVQLDTEPQSTAASSPGDFWQNAIGADGRIHACYGRLLPTFVTVNLDFRNDILCVHEVRS